jgi:signal transduction histidine kinase
MVLADYPRREPDGASPRAGRIWLEERSMSSGHVLVVDDSTTVRKMLRRSLESARYEVVEASTGTDALKLLEAEAFDLVTLDIEMEDMGGFEVCAGLRSLESRYKRKHTPVIFITGNDTIEDRRRGFEVGAADFILKPVKDVDLVTRIERILKTTQRLTGLTALVTDDSTVARRIVSSSLKEQGLQVLEAESGEQALEVLRRPDCHVDLLITDYDMPGMDGGELCRRVRTSLGMPWLPIIFLSGMAEKTSIIEMFAAGATDYLIKPFAKEELVARISVQVEIRRLSLERARRIQELEHLHALKDSFLAIASHDLRAPLNGILGAAELMLMEDDLPATYREYAEMINSSGKSLLSLLGDLLDLAKIETTRDRQEFGRIDLAETVDDALGGLRPTAAAKGIALTHRVETGGRPALLDGDRHGIMRIVTNLVSNGIKFTPAGGRVAVMTEVAADGGAVVSVADTGIGIPIQHVPLLFDRFSKASRAGTSGESSTGLGMAITKELVEQHFGHVEVRTEVGRGTTFIISFPPVAA